MTGSQRVILLACGSFNPPTNMHLRMFEIARDFLHRTTNYNVVAGLMSPVHDKYGKEGLASASDRIQMLRLALNSSSWVHVSEWETAQDDWTPTRESVQYHQNLIQTTLHKLGRSSASSRHHARELLDSVVNGNVDPSVKRQRLDASQSWLNHLTTSTDPVCVKLLCGADLLESFAKPGLWKDEDIEALVGKYGIVVITREGSNPYKFIYESDVLTKHQKNIHIVTEWITNEVSSTKVRRALRRGESVKYLVQDSVIDYIYKNALFNTHNNKYFYSPYMLTPSPNPDTDVLLPPPNFTHNQGHGRSRGTLLASRQHPIRKSSVFSDMEEDSPGGSIDDPPLVPTHSSTGKSYPGMAIPTKSGSPVCHL
ncbi:nicotinamide/nicotinic acid mononucleotide adenylyltransferase 1 isoform X2 [Macrobrachium rosenbergii]|uniref:nicotinamide/nicotinic acid mononucleotide adenylyltransferase 1 isoform X2 n=1 Tax=Macrobrachium rosenbergii TaxID=79674 RepID=UPI0034D6C9A8